MRTGAIFARRARGSCGALKWAALLGAFLVLGSVQAVAQPAIEDASFTLAQPNSVIIKMTEPVYADGNQALLASDFRLVDSGTAGSDAADTAAIRIDGLATTRLGADDSFTLVFPKNIYVDRNRNGRVEESEVYGVSYTLSAATAGQARAIRNQQYNGTNATATTLQNIARGTPQSVRLPGQTRELTLSFTPAERRVLEMARERSQVYARHETFVAARQLPAIVLPAAEGPPGATITYALTAPLLTIEPLANAAATPTATGGLNFQADERALAGTMPNEVGDYTLVYTASTTTPAASDSVTFTLKVADEPEAPTITRVETVSNSSVKVVWSKPRSDNNDVITHYELGYRLEGQDDDRETWKTPVATATATTSHTLAGLDPGTYEVRVRAVNSIGNGPWSVMKSGSTGTGAQTPRLTLSVGPTLPEGRNDIPVTVTATVDPSAETVRALSVQLTLGKGAADSAEFSTDKVTESNPDVSWVLPDAKNPAMSQPVEFRFTSNLSSEHTIYLNTGSDPDAEPENFKITAASKAVPNVFGAGKATASVMVDDDEVQVYELELPYQVGANKEFTEGYGDRTLPVNLMVSPPRTVATNYIVSLTSKEDASDYSLLSPSSGSPSSVGTRVSLLEGSMGEELTLTPVQNDGDRVDDTITLQLFMADAAGVKGRQLGEDIVLTVLDRHMLPTVSLGTIMVEGSPVTSLAEGETGTVELLAPRGTTTDAVPDNESIKVMLSLAATSEAGANDFRLGSPEVSVGTKTSATFELEALVDDADVDDEMLVLQAEVTGSAANGPGDTVPLAAITITDGTMKLVWAKTQDEVETAIYDAKNAGMGADEEFTPGEMIEVVGRGLFNAADGVTLSYSAESSDPAVASVMSGDGTVTVTAMGEGDAMVTITAHASMPSGVKINDQTDPREASITFPVEVGLEALSFMLTGPEDMNIVEGGMAHVNGTMGAAMLTVTANRAVGMDTEVMIMRDRATSTAMDSDYMPVPTMITIESGETMGSVEITATEDDMAEDMEELVLYGMVGDMMVEGQVKLYIWDAAVPALPIIAQLLLAAFLAIGGYRRYLRR